VTVTKQGTIRAPGGPGLGFKIKRERVEDLTVRAENLS
jgi:hypothetical protein